MRKLKKYTPSPFMLKTSHYDKDAADFVVAFIEQLKHTKGEFYKQPFELIDWQEKIIRDIFGTLKPDGYRQFTTAYIEVPKKCGKSELAAAVALYMLCADGEQRAEVYGCAADRDQASLVFDVACDMVRLCPALERRCNIRPSTKSINFEMTNSRYKAVSADVAGKSGINVSALIFDELWVQKDRKFFEMMTVGTSDARKNPLHFIITTAGNDTNTICYELHQKALRANNQQPCDIVAGIRPEHVTMGPGGLSANVDVCEMMGSSLHLHTDCAGDEVVLVVSTVDVDQGLIDGTTKKVDFTFPANLLQLFDKETGNNLVWFDKESAAKNAPVCSKF